MEPRLPSEAKSSQVARPSTSRSVLIISNVFPPQVIGGAEIVAQRQAKALARQGFEVSVLAGLEDETARPESRLIVEMHDGLRVFRLAAPPVGPERSHRRPELEEYARAVLRVVRPDFVHLHHLSGLGTGLIPLAKATGAHVVVTLHDSWGFCLRQTQLRDGPQLCEDSTECDLCLASVPGELGERLPVRMRRDYVRWCLERADRLLFPSRSLQDSYARASLPTSRFVHLSNGIDLEAFPARQRDPNDQVAFLCLSTLGEHKGVRVLWDSLELLLQDHELAGRWRMMLGGKGPLEPELRARFDRGTLRAPVSWAGFIPRRSIPAVYDRADVLVLASICPENQPVALLEAAASGAAQLGTRIGGIPELIEDGRSGLLVEAGDAVALAAAMRQLILNPSLVRAFSARNLARRHKFDEAASIAQLTQLFSDPAPAPSVSKRPIVLCSGEMANVAAGSSASRHLRRLDDRLRLLWHGWIDPGVQIGADVLCIFGEQCPVGAIGRAVVARTPIVVPRHMSLDLVLGCKSLVHSYDTEAEALDLAETIALARAGKESL